MMVVISNGVYGWIKAGQKAGFGQRYFSVDFSRTNHARVAETLGVKAWHVEDREALKPALAAAAEHSGATLVDIVAQPLHEAHAPGARQRGAESSGRLTFALVTPRAVLQ